MVKKLFVCGSTGSFQRQIDQEDDHCDIGSPRKPKKGSKNPFADRGLDKFSALLAELEDKKKQIYTQFGSEDIAFIRFDYSNSNRGKPIVVRVKEKEKDHKQQQDKDDEPIETNNSAVAQVEESQTEPRNKKDNDQRKQSFSWDFLKREKWRKPSFYLPAVMIMILLFVVLFGRSFAILCTSVGWYMIPAITGGESNVRRAKKKKDHGRRGSDKGMIVRGGKKNYVRRGSDKGMSVDGEAAGRTSPARGSPTSVISGAMTEFLPEKRVHWKSF